MRIITSGTRHADDSHVAEIGRRLNPYARRGLGALAHGAAPGVDSLAAALFTTWGWQVKAIPADWDRCDDTVPYELGGCPVGRPHRKTRRDGTSYCPRAGNRRNQQLVDLTPKADLVVAFPAVGSAGRGGTWDLCARAADAGLHIEIWPVAVGR